MTSDPHPRNYHISSLVAQFHPKHQALLQAQISALPGVEIHAQGEGAKWVITLEGDNQQQIDRHFHHISQLVGVLSVVLVYQQVALLTEDER